MMLELLAESALRAIVLGGGVWLSLMLLRLLFGWLVMWRVARAAHPVNGVWTEGVDVRVSGVVRGPVTFASTILLPPSYTAWGAATSGDALPARTLRSRAASWAFGILSRKKMLGRPRSHKKFWQ